MYKKSNFSQKCTLLSQYLKENGSFGDLNLELSAKLTADQTTKNLLPMVEKSAPIHQDLNQSPKGHDKETSPMTIFYDGKVIVFEKFTQEKANEIMDFANKASGISQQNYNISPPPAPNTPFRNPLAEGDMPIMRNRSLARFIAKRKDRIRAKAPYQANNGEDESSSKNLDDSKSWLGFAAESSSHQTEIQFL